MAAKVTVRYFAAARAAAGFDDEIIGVAPGTTVGTLVAFVSYVSMVTWPVRQMGRILSELSKALVAVGRMPQ